jgi:hypothetical protein
VALRIACDLDGTVADMDAALQRHAEALFGADVDLHKDPTIPIPFLQSPANFTGTDASANAEAGPAPAAVAAAEPQKRALTDKERRALWAHVGRVENFWASLEEIEPGTVARLNRLAVEHGWEVIFLTQRPACAGDTTQRQSQQWLTQHGFEYPSVFVMNGSRGKVADALALDAVIDDRPNNCLDVVTDSTARAFLVWRDDPTRTPPGAQRVGITLTYSFSEALDQLEKMMATRNKTGIFGRIKNALGM